MKNLKKIGRLFSILTFSIFAISCSNEDENTTANPEPSDITPTLIGRGELYGSGEENIPEQNLVITNATEWNNLKTQMNITNNVSSGFNENGIDFSNCKIIASFDEVEPNGGHALDNTNIVETEENITVTIQHTGPEGNATTVMTQPFSIVRIPISPKPIVFN
jgi:hypothetical protein